MYESLDEGSKNRKIEKAWSLKKKPPQRGGGSTRQRWRPASRRGDSLGQPCPKLVLRQRADLLAGHLTILEKEKGGDAANVVRLRDSGIALNVQLYDLELPFEFLGEFLKDRADHAARPAPFGPEIHEDRQLSLFHLNFESCIGHGCCRHESLFVLRGAQPLIPMRGE
jgi:hypothetical protein